MTHLEGQCSLNTVQLLLRNLEGGLGDSLWTPAKEQAGLDEGSCCCLVRPKIKVVIRF